MKWRRLVPLPRSRCDISRDVDEELHFHLRAREEELLSAGKSPAEASAQARREFGDIDDARRYAIDLDHRTESSRRRKDYMSEFIHDVRYALRTLFAARTFTFAALVTLALGIGAGTGVFSVVYGVLLKPLPYPEPQQLYRVWSANRTSGSLQASISAMDLDDWRTQRRVIDDVGGYYFQTDASGMDLTGDGDPQRLSAIFVTPGFFRALGVSPLHGRLPRDEELVRGGPDRVVVLTHAFWTRHFAADAGVVGKSMTLSGEPFTVIGVLPPEFSYPTASADLVASFSIFTDDQIPRLRFVRLLGAIARIKPGVSEEQLNEELQLITRRLAEQYPENAAWDHATAMPLAESITGNVKQSLWVLLGAVGFLLLIVCANVASLQLARATVRSGEIAVRAALGATRARITRQLLTESLVLSGLGALAGIVVAVFTVRLLNTLGEGQLPRGADVKVDGWVLLFALLLAVVTGLLFGLAPALVSGRSIQRSLREARSTVDRAGARLWRGLIIVEVALAMLLVVAGGLMVRSYAALNNVDPGFDPRNLLGMNFTLSTERLQDYRLAYAQILERVRAIPGVVSAGVAKDAPFRGSGESAAFTLPGMVVPAGEDPPNASMINISDGYFQAIGARMISGREFAATDHGQAPPVIVVNQSFARRWFPGEDATGKRMLSGGQVSAEIVGVVADIRQTELARDARETIYLHQQQVSRTKMNLLIRTAGPPLAMTRAVTQAIREVDPLQTITGTFSMEDALNETLARPRLVTALIGTFGFLGLALGALGLYGVLAYLVQQRRKDIGIRLALGEPPKSILQRVVRQGVVLAAIGVVIGTAGALALGRLIAGVLYGVTPTDPVTISVVALILLSVALLASLLPARRAAAVDLMTTLRSG